MILKRLIEENGFVLYVVTDDKFLPKDCSKKSLNEIRDIVKKCADGGAKIFQYRAKNIDTYIELKHAETAKDECEKNKIVFAVNDRVDLAHILQAQIIHTGQEDIPPEIIKENFPHLNIGFSTHNRKQVSKAMEISDILDYISFGPVFGTKTKENPYPKTGIKNLRWAVSRSKIPVVAIGGINSKNIQEVVSSGARAVAVISFILEDKKKIRQRCEELIKKANEVIK